MISADPLPVRIAEGCRGGKRAIGFLDEENAAVGGRDEPPGLLHRGVSHGLKFKSGTSCSESSSMRCISR